MVSRAFRDGWLCKVSKWLKLTSHSVYGIAIEGTSPAMAQREIIRRVEAHTGRKVGDWEVSSAMYVMTDKKRPPIEIVSFSDVEGRIFVLVNSVLTEMDQSFLQVIKKISAYQLRGTRTIKGSEYDFVDFCVRVGLAFRQQTPTGVIVEIEYRPCPVTDDCERLIGELMERIAAPLVPPPQTSGDHSVSVAATTAYNYKRVEVDAAKAPKDDLVPFSNRSAALLYAKLLRT